ncbi:MAG: transporter substrate-binding domain-containing protein [Proteobacteria bacterium]|nr:transporter substrate-binding domain-containing protein [Pseudomonadota bacterium]
MICPLPRLRPVLWPALLLATLALPASGQTPVRMATAVERNYFAAAEPLLRKAYGALGLEVEFLPWPLPSTDVELRAGRLDAVAMRADAFFEQRPYLRKVDVPLLQLQVYAFARPPCPRSISREELARGRVSLQRGMVAAEALVPEGQRVPANTISDAMLNLAGGAADYAVTLSSAALTEVPVITRHGAVCVVPTPLAKATLYHGVHEAHTAWIPALEQALRGMRERGEIQQAWADHERQATQDAVLQAQPGRSLLLTPAATPGSAPARPQQ